MARDRRNPAKFPDERQKRAGWTRSNGRLCSRAGGLGFPPGQLSQKALMTRRYRQARSFLTRLGWVSIVGLAIGGAGLGVLAVKAYSPMASAVAR